MENLWWIWSREWAARAAQRVTSLWRGGASLDAADRLHFERQLQLGRLTFLSSPFLVLFSVGWEALPVALLITAVTALSYIWIETLLRRAPATLLRLQVPLRLVDCALVFMVLTPYHAILHHAYYDSVYILFVVAAAATHGRRGALALAVGADLALSLSRSTLVLSGAIAPEARHSADSMYYLVFFAVVGVAVASLMERSADVVQRREQEWRAALAARNRELEHTAAQLTATNQELEAFAYSVSHDLRAPLRAIDGFSRVVMEGAEAALTAQQRDYLRRVRAASQRMAQLIDDLLHLSRVTRSELHREPVDLSAIAADVIAALQESQPGRSVDVRIEPHLRAEGDPRLLRVALENLLGNAWKFTARRPDAAIWFGFAGAAQVAAGEAAVGDAPVSPNETGDGRLAAYVVRDNGAGFDMAFAGKLFGAFQRLHAADEFEGTGIGLATVQRVIHRHGGRIWARSAPGEGAAFLFTL